MQELLSSKESWPPLSQSSEEAGVPSPNPLTAPSFLLLHLQQGTGFSSAALERLKERDGDFVRGRCSTSPTQTCAPVGPRPPLLSRYPTLSWPGTPMAGYPLLSDGRPPPVPTMVGRRTMKMRMSSSSSWRSLTRRRRARRVAARRGRRCGAQRRSQYSSARIAPPSQYGIHFLPKRIYLKCGR